MSGEQLAHPAARSMSLPFDALLSGAAEAADFPDDDADANLANVSRRFSSDPAVPSAVRPIYTHHSHGSYRSVRPDSRPSRKERVKALALWYDRMANRSRVPDGDDDDDDDNVLLPTDSNQKLASRAGSWGYSIEESLPLSGRSDRRDAARKQETVGSLQQEIGRLRQELTQERSEKMSLEQTASSLENALQFSKKKVNEQKETISRLENDVRKAQSLAPCLKEILSVSERHYMAKELALKRVIQGLSAERDSAVEMSHRVDVMSQRSRPRTSWTGQGVFN